MAAPEAGPWRPPSESERRAQRWWAPGPKLIVAIVAGVPALLLAGPFFALLFRDRPAALDLALAALGGHCFLARNGSPIAALLVLGWLLVSAYPRFRDRRAPRPSRPRGYRAGLVLSVYGTLLSALGYLAIGHAMKGIAHVTCATTPSLSPQVAADLGRAIAIHVEAWILFVVGLVTVHWARTSVAGRRSSLAVVVSCTLHGVFVLFVLLAVLQSNELLPK